ncbi:hypothetical protein RvY_04790 [Ramazzottius varieornatus]|uniref:Uncharacterized protein n=1 Tax=Ramazzottius varieornatus TaxID=947166 RepID=A0A1D1UZG8_RAMVA|nr:hypothetical protein RvY_04790 [Ramazzottius varieornatus]
MPTRVRKFRHFAAAIAALGGPFVAVFEVVKKVCGRPFKLRATNNSEQAVQVQFLDLWFHSAYGRYEKRKRRKPSAGYRLRSVRSTVLN